MSKRLLAAIAALAGLGLAAGAVPAFTADSGTVTLSITAAPPSEPCLKISVSSVNYGTQPFSSSGLPSSATGNVAPEVENCSTAGEQVLSQGTDATGPSATWSLITDRTRLFCNTGSRNEFTLRYGVGGDPIVQPIGKTQAIVTSLLPGGVARLTFELTMPCTGSDGAGQTLSTSIVLTAVIP